jgi:hypothetical protein
MTGSFFVCCPLSRDRRDADDGVELRQCRQPAHIDAADQ